MQAAGRVAIFGLLSSLTACGVIAGYDHFEKATNSTASEAGARSAEGGPALAASTLGLGPKHSCAVMTDLSLRCWGLNDLGQLGVGDTATKSVPTVVPKVKDVTFLSPGDKHTCVVNKDGEVWCWGSNESGQLGSGPADSAPHPNPVRVDGADPARKVQAGRNHTCIETTAKTVQCWGANQHGQLGDGTNVPKTSPQQVPNLTGVQKLSSSSDSSCAVALHADAGGNAVFCWGL